jgi:hypothetical protein
MRFAHTRPGSSSTLGPLFLSASVVPLAPIHARASADIANGQAFVDQRLADVPAVHARVLDNRLQKLEAEREPGQTRIIWTTVSDGNGRLRDMTDVELDREIAARKAAGTIGDHDRLLLIGWAAA